MKLALMTTPDFFVEEDKILTALFDVGLDTLHLRKPGKEPIYSERLLTLLPEDCREKTIVHDNYYLKEEYYLKGICIEDEATPKPQGYKGHLYRMVNDPQTLKAAKKNADNVILNGVFGECADGAQLSADTLERIADSGLTGRHVYALGGLNADNIRLAKQLGFGGVVVCDDIWSRFRIHDHQDFRHLITHFEKLKRLT